MTKPVITKTASQILREAATSARQHGLIPGTLVKEVEPGKFCYCAMGHIALVAGFKPIKKKTGYGSNRWDFAHINGDYDELETLEAIQVLARTIGEADEFNKKSTATNTIIMFNDPRAHSIEGRKQIIEMMDKAAENC